MKEKIDYIIHEMLLLHLVIMLATTLEVNLGEREMNISLLLCLTRLLLHIVFRR